MQITRKSKTGWEVDATSIEKTETGYGGVAVAKLAQYEALHQLLLDEQVALSKELGYLRDQGKKGSLQFKELMIKKLNGSNALSLLKWHGIE